MGLTHRFHNVEHRAVKIYALLPDEVHQGQRHYKGRKLGEKQVDILWACRRLYQVLIKSGLFLEYGLRYSANMA